MLQRASSGFDNSHVDELMFEREIHEELARVKAFYVEKVFHCELQSVQHCCMIVCHNATILTAPCLV